jgi:hypothetical protein
MIISLPPVGLRNRFQAILEEAMVPANGLDRDITDEKYARIEMTALARFHRVANSANWSGIAENRCRDGWIRLTCAVALRLGEVLNVETWGCGRCADLTVC